jgi:hypothetical protein
MAKSKDQLQADAEKLRNKLAEAEAIVGGLRSRLAKIDAQLTGQPAPLTGLDMLWKAALPISRTRSSKLLCRKAWLSIPIQDRPPIHEAVSALHAWNRCPEWKKDDHQYAIALDRWIRERRWEDLPESSSSDPLSRYRNTPPPRPVSDPADEITDPGEIAKILSVRVSRMNS